MTTSYLVQEDGVSHILLGNETGALILDASSPIIVSDARPVGIPHAYEPRHYQTIRGKGVVALPGLGATASGIVVRPKARPTAAVLTGRATVTLPLLSASAVGAVLVSGAGAAALSPLTAQGTGRHDIFHDDQLAVINSILALL